MDIPESIKKYQGRLGEQLNRSLKKFPIFKKFADDHGIPKNVGKSPDEVLKKLRDQE